MKLSLAFVALAGAVAPPRIELNLEGMTSAYKLKDVITREHDLNYVQNDASKVMSRQDWTEKCAAYGKCTDCDGSDQLPTNKDGAGRTNAANCPFPVANGFDHQDRNVDVTTRIFLVDIDGEACTSNCDKTITKGSTQDVDFVNFDVRSTYLFKYDAKDSAGNHAEQVVFALILDDTEAPLFEQKCESGKTFEPAITVEAVSDWTLCQLEAHDNVDSTTAASTYKINYLGRNHEEFSAANVRTNFFAAEAKANLAKGSTYAEAKAYFTPKSDGGFGPSHVGKYLVTISTVDTAGVYGHNAENNERHIQQAVLIRDTVNPTIYLAGNNPEYVECRKAVSDGGRPTGTAANWDFEAFTGAESDCRDQLDTVALGRYLPVTTTINNGNAYIVGDHTHKDAGVYPQGLETRQTGLADELKVKGTHSLDYTCSDYADNEAATVTRTINTVDTHQPTLTLKHNGATEDFGNTHTVIYELKDDDASTDVTKIHADEESQIYCEDSCDKNVNADTDGQNGFSMSWGPRAFNAKILGDYVRTYTCSDADDNTATKTRTYTVIDSDLPEITKMPSNGDIAPGTFEATRDNEYTDTGATCHDFVDGELSHAVEVSGEVVNMRIPGTYTINYDCQDLSGNAAVQQTREIVIVDSTKPYLALTGNQLNYVEAGFPYVDAGATATDTLDGDITQYIWTDGNTITTSHAFYAEKSCTGIFDNAGTTDGKYQITVELPDGSFARQLVNCFRHVSTDGSNGQIYTYYHHVAGNAVDCPSMGMKKTSNAAIKAHAGGSTGNLDDYLCTVTEITRSASTTLFHHNKMGGAESGRYVIKFNVEDKAGNAASKVMRTVIVKDTLPPVITLHLKNKLVHTSAIGQQGQMTQNPANLDMTNPAGYLKGAKASEGDRYTYVPKGQTSRIAFGNPYMKDNLMAESTSTNGWLIGAVASAVAGVALLGFSRKSSVTSVPV
jgi:hypothetical protein